MNISRSNDTIKNRIKNMSENIEKTVTDKLSKRHFALQIEESADKSGKAHILGFVRLLHENEIVNQFLCCLELTESSTGQDVFDSILPILNNSKYHGSCVWEFVRTVLHQRKSLLSKTLPVALKPVLDKAANMVNFIKSKPLKIRVFINLGISMEVKYESLLLHTEVRWLSLAKVLRRFIKLKAELMTFFQKENMDDLKMTYGRKENFLTLTDKLTAFWKKVIFWKSCVLEKKKVDIFPYLNHKTTDEIISAVTEHLTLSEEKIEFYFPSINVETYDWLRNPLAKVDTLNSKLSYQEEEEELIFLEMVLMEF
ncbi:zinc finger BED domain-containing protein 5-like [Hydra vulgaris]|uniref:Zinc finger BED domain-containing protein 5-like n=1 Tax=Hydra vulgaris TaxID=6087 RepID=A0ABM4B8W7_HYDVU